MKDLNKLSKEIYEANASKGFHEEKYSLDHMICLVISELMEAVEADRKGRRANIEYVKTLTKPTSKSLFDVLFKNGVKDSIEDEFADAVIRLLDTAGALELNLKAIIKGDNLRYYGTQYAFNNRSLTENIYDIIDKYFRKKPLTIDAKISNMIFDIDILCEVMNIDLWQHVDLKLKYNSLRPYKHGKQY